MKKAITILLTLSFYILIQFSLESCKKEPIEQSKYYFFDKLDGLWVLVDYTASLSGWGGGDPYGQIYSKTSVFSNHVVTSTNIMTIYNYPNVSVDTTIYSFLYIKQLAFSKYKNDILLYKELTINSDSTTTIVNSMDWSKLTVDKLSIIIESKNCKLEIDSSDNIVITYDYSDEHVNSGKTSHIRWIFRKVQ